jgi:hypothetical protein
MGKQRHELGIKGGKMYMLFLKELLNAHLEAMKDRLLTTLL